MALTTGTPPAQIAGQTLSFQLNTSSPTQLALGTGESRYRHAMVISNNDLVNIVSVWFGTNNGAANPGGHLIPPGGSLVMGEAAIAGGSGPQTGTSCVKTDVSAIAVTGTPIVSYTEW